MAEAALKKLDGQLRRLIREWQANREAAPPAERANADVGERAAPERLTVHITFRGDPQAIRDAGFDVQGVAGSTARVILTADRLEALAAVDGVVTVHAPPRVGPLLDRSIPEIRADTAWSVERPTVGGPSRGRGVVVGIADSGIDVFHGAFRNPDGTTRILFLWDQVFNDPAPHPSGFDHGIEFDAAAINQALTAHPDGEGLPDSLLDDVEDTRGHGTHVAGIAAGDGSDADRCGHEGEYVGVAPEADLIVVKMGFGKDKYQNYLEAVEYIFRKAGPQPCVVNLSLGGHFGPHNGAGHKDKRLRDLMAVHEQLGLLLGHGTKMIVAAAGNDRDNDSHAFVTVAPGATETIRVSVFNVEKLGVFISHNGDASVECRVNLPERPGRVRMTDFVVTEDDHQNTWFDDHTITFDDFTPQTEDPDLHFNILAKRTTAGAKIESGTWQFELRNTGAAGDPRADCHLWIYAPSKVFPNAMEWAACEPPQGAASSPQDADRWWRKRPAAWIASTVAIPGTADSVITVGAYNAEEHDNLASFSDQGPTVDGRAKPEISAPGMGIDSAKGNARRCWLACECCVNRYWPKQGTSMAAPHVTGVVALMLAQNPNATPAEITEMLLVTARTPPALPSGWPPSVDLYGAGLVDAHAAVVAANNSAGGSAPVPPPLPSPFVALGQRPAFEWDWRARVREWNGRFGARPAWQLFSALVSEHFDEVERLVNGNKRIGAVWRRNGGPALARHLLALSAETEVLIPRTIQGCEPERLLRGMLQQLERFGSAALRSDARRYGTFAAALPGARLADLDRLLAGAGCA